MQHQFLKGFGSATVLILRACEALDVLCSCPTAAHAFSSGSWKVGELNCPFLANEIGGFEG